MAIKQKRDKGLKIMMTESTFTRLHDLGELLGQSPSTLASMAVSELVQKYMGQVALQDKAVKAMVDLVGPELKSQMKITEAMQ
jgi:hypothetical protein